MAHGVHGSSQFEDNRMIPPKGFQSEVYPLRHRLVYGFGLSAITTQMNTAFATLVRHTSDVIANTPKIIVVNPHNPNYVKDAGAAVQKMSIIDKLTLSIKFNLTSLINDKAETAAGTFTGDGMHHIHLLWRPIFFSFQEKLLAADDDTTTTVEAILALTSDTTFEDVVPLTTNKLPGGGSSDLVQPTSSVNIVEVFGDYNMTTNTTMEDHVWDESLFQEALMRYTNKGALKACVGRTRHVHLTRNKPFHNDFIRKFVPRAIRRVMPYTFMGIQVHVPETTEIGQDYHRQALTPSLAHVGCKIICQYHEWNADHFQDMTGAAPVPP